MPSSLPERAAIFITALEQAAPEHAENVVHSTLTDLWGTVKNTLPTEEAVAAFLRILSHLDDSFRQYDTHLILKIKE